MPKLMWRPNKRELIFEDVERPKHNPMINRRTMRGYLERIAELNE